MMFEKDYYVRSKISNYEDYRKRNLDKMASELKDYFKWDENTRILDYGAATGCLLSALKLLGIKYLIGTDISYWAIEFGRKKYNLSNNELQHYNRELLEQEFDYILMLDVLEHICDEELDQTLCMTNTGNILLVRIPIAAKEGDGYLLEVSNCDKSHIQCHDRQWWKSLLARHGYVFNGTINLPTIYDSDGVFVGIFKKNIKI